MQKKKSAQRNKIIVIAVCSALQSAVLIGASLAFASAEIFSRNSLETIRDSFGLRAGIVAAFADYSASVKNSEYKIRADMIKHDNAESAFKIEHVLSEMAEISLKIKISAAALSAVFIISGLAVCISVRED